MSALDDLKMIHERDAQDALGIAEKQAQQYLHNFGFKWEPPKPIYEVIAGMGGSGLAAKAYKVASDLQVPFEVIQDYSLPSRTGENTLLICSSYSGNTEETLSVFEEAVNEERAYPMPMIVVVAAGGKLIEKAKQHNLPYIQLPADYQPRFTFGFQYRALAEIFASTTLRDNEIPILEADANWLSEQIAKFRPDVATPQNLTKQLALELMGSSPVVYASSLFAAVAYKWKISFNENAKNVAWYGVYPEFNHNEFLGWSSHPIDKPYKIVDLVSNLDHPQTQKRFEISDRLLSGKRPAAHTVQLEGDSLLRQTLYGVAYGDFVSLYSALLNGLNPTPVDLITKLKNELVK
jgi:glucose/mannose-6-phosphate isomerase